MNKNKIPKQVLGFFSISLAWMITMIILFIHRRIIYGWPMGVRLIATWSAMFVLVAWAVFIILPLAILNHSRKIFRIQFLPFVTGIYGMAIYSLFIYYLFGSIDVLLMFLIWALIIGVLFGLIYSTLISSQRLIALLNQKPVLKIFTPLGPLILSAVLWWLLPAFPAFTKPPKGDNERILTNNWPDSLANEAGFDSVRILEFHPGQKK
jgi:hypothetical protein